MRTPMRGGAFFAGLAVLLQLLAPVWEMRAIAAAASDLLAVAAVCTTGVGVPAHHAPGHAHGGICSACQSCAAHPFLAASTPVPPAPRPAVVVERTARGDAIPRGPPNARPRARGPPFLS